MADTSRRFHRVAQSASEFPFLTGCRLIPSLYLSLYHFVPPRTYAGHVRNSCELRRVCVVQQKAGSHWTPRFCYVYVMENEGTEVEERETESPAGVRTGEKERDRKRKRERERLRVACVVCGLHTYTGCLECTVFRWQKIRVCLKTETCTYRRRVYKKLKLLWVDSVGADKTTRFYLSDFYFERKSSVSGLVAQVSFIERLKRDTRL